jgi:hypothetical protein
MIGAMTFHTKRWLDGNYSFKSITINSPDDIKKYIWDKFKDSFSTDKEKDSFIKGMTLCDFSALYKWTKQGR